MKIKRKYIGITLILLSCILLIASVNAADTNQTTNIQTATNTITTPEITTTTNIEQNTTKTDNIKQSTTTQDKKIQTTNKKTNTNTQTTTTENNQQSATDNHTSTSINTKNSNLNTQFITNLKYNTQITNTQLKTLNNNGTYKQVVKLNSNTQSVFNVSTDYELNNSINSIITNGSNQKNYTINLISKKTYKITDNYNLWNNNTNNGVTITINCQGNGIEMPSTCIINLSNKSSLTVTNMSSGFLNVINYGNWTLNYVALEDINSVNYNSYNKGNLLINNSIIRNFNGNILNNDGNLTLINSIITDNSQIDQPFYNKGQYNTTTNANSVFINNGTMIIDNCTINNNKMITDIILDQYWEGGYDYIPLELVTDYVNSYMNVSMFAYGGVISNYKILIIKNSDIKDNSMSTSSYNATFYGGVIYNLGDLNITGTNITNTKCEGYEHLYGGVIYNRGNMNITSSKIEDAQTTSSNTEGSMIYNNNGTLNLTKSALIINNNKSNIIYSVNNSSVVLEKNWWSNNNPNWDNILFNTTKPTQWIYLTLSSYNDNTTLFVKSDFNKLTNGKSIITAFGNMPDGVVVNYTNTSNGRSIDNTTHNGIGINTFYNKNTKIINTNAIIEGITTDNSVRLQLDWIQSYTKIVEINEYPIFGGKLLVKVQIMDKFSDNLINGTGYCVYKISGKTVKDSNNNEVRIPVTNGTCNITYSIPESFKIQNRNITVLYKSLDNTYRNSSTTENFRVYTNIKINLKKPVINGTQIIFEGNITDTQGNIFNETNTLELVLNRVMINSKVPLVNGRFYYVYNDTLSSIEGSIIMYKQPSDLSTENRIRANYILNKTEGFMNVTTNNTNPTIDQTIKITAKYDKNSPYTPNRIVFKIDGLTIKNKNGTVKTAPIINSTTTIEYTIPSNFRARNYTITAVFIGNNFKEESNTTIKLERAPTHIVSDDQATTNKNYIYVTGKIFDQYNNLVKYTTKVTIKLNNKTQISQATVNNGIINLKLTYNFKVNSYVITIIAGDNSRYESSKIYTLLVVKNNNLKTLSSNNKLETAYNVNDFNSLYNTIEAIKANGTKPEYTINLNNGTYNVNQNITWGNTTTNTTKKLIINGNQQILNFNKTTNQIITSSNYTLILNNININNGITPVINSGNMTITNSNFNNNCDSTQTQGGAIYNDIGFMNITNCNFTNNTASNGGAIYNYYNPPSYSQNDYTNMNITNTKFINNTASYKGGAIYNYYGNINIKNLTFTDNTAFNGGALVKEGGSINITNSHFDNNTASSAGGAIYSSINYMNLINNTFTNNKAGTGTSGGAIYNNNCYMNITKNNFINNTAAFGGVIANYNGNLNITYNNFINNIADFGVAIYNPSTTSNLNVSYNTFTNNTNDLKQDVLIRNQGTLKIHDNIYTEDALNTIIKSIKNTTTNNGYLLEIKVTPNHLYNTTVTNGTITVYINNQTFNSVNVINGKANVTIPFNKLPKENNNITIVYNSSDYSYQPTTTSFNIKSRLNTTITVEPVIGIVNETTNITARITDQNNKSVNSGRVAFKVNGKTLVDTNGKTIYATVKDGKATINYTIPTSWIKDNITITAVMGDNSYYNGARSNKTTAQIYKRNATMNITISENPTKDLHNITLTAKITDTITKKTLNSGRVVFKINGITIKDKNGNVIYTTVLNGIAKMKYTIPQGYKAKNYTITSVYGNNIYNRTEKNETLTIQK